MSAIEGLKKTGREVSGPGFNVVEFEHGSGLSRMGIVYDEQYKDHAALGRDVREVLGFLEQPEICDLLELTEYHPEHGLFCYPAGTCWSIAEILETFASQGMVGGARAGLELCYMVGRVLHEASQVGPDRGVYCHGSLSPWHIFVKPDGQIQLIGYGLPQMDVLVYREEDGQIPSEDGLRYCPPERLDGNAEDVVADLLSLCLVAFELMVGEPLYNGLAKEILQQAINGQGPYRLFQYRDKLPESVIEFISRALKYDPDARFADANEFVWAARDVLGLPEIDGMTLIEVVQEVRQARERSHAIMGGKTSSMSKEDLASLREMLDAPDAKPLPEPTGTRPEEEVIEAGQPRWGSVSRIRSSGADEPKPSPAPEPEPPPPPPEPVEPLRRSSSERESSLRGRLGKSKEDRRKSLRDRLKGERKRRVREPEEEEEENDEEEKASLEQSEAENGSDAVNEKGISEETSDDLVEHAETDVDVEVEHTVEEDDEDEDLEAEKPVDGNIEAEKEEPVSEKPQDAAAALLARLRGSQDSRVSPQPTVAPTLRSSASTPAPAPSKPQTSVSRSLVSSGQRIMFQVSLEGQASRPVKLKLGDSLSETAYRLGQALAGIPVDLTGQIAGWYRLAQGDQSLEGSLLVDDLDTEMPVEIQWIESHMQRLEIVVEGLDSEMRFQAPVACHVPSSYLLRHMARWLDLPGGDWKMFVGESCVLPMQTLCEFDLQNGAKIVVKK